MAISFGRKGASETARALLTNKCAEVRVHTELSKSKSCYAVYHVAAGWLCLCTRGTTFGQDWLEDTGWRGVEAGGGCGGKPSLDEGRNWPELGFKRGSQPPGTALSSLGVKTIASSLPLLRQTPTLTLKERLG